MAAATAVPVAPRDGLITDWTGIKEEKKTKAATPASLLVLPPPTRVVYLKKLGDKAWFESREPRRVVYDGITKRLPEIFYPTYGKGDRAIYGPDTPETGGKQPRINRGLAFGTKIHDQVRKAVDLMSTHGMSVSELLGHIHWFEAKKAKNLKRKKAGKKMKRGKANPLRTAVRKMKLHKATVRVLAYLMDELRLHPVYADLPVVCVDGLAATGIDILCVHVVTKEIWVIELKTNYCGVYEKHTNNFMNSPFDGLSDSYKNQHLAQLLTTMAFFISTYPTVCRGRKVNGIVLRVHGKGVIPNRIPDEYTRPVLHGAMVTIWKKFCRIADSHICVRTVDKCGCTCCTFRLLLNSCAYIISQPPPLSIDCLL
jgi:hypothetical protein